MLAERDPRCAFRSFCCGADDPLLDLGVARGRWHQRCSRRAFDRAVELAVVALQDHLEVLDPIVPPVPGGDLIIVPSSHNRSIMGVL